MLPLCYYSVTSLLLQYYLSNKQYILIDILTRDREVTAILKNQIEKGTVWICERHYLPNEIYVYPSRKLLKEGALPTQNLPVKSISAKKL